MAGELESAILTGFDPLKGFKDAFGAVSDANIRMRGLDLQHQRLEQSLALREGLLSVREGTLDVARQRAAVSAGGQQLVNALRQKKLEEEAQKIQEAQDYQQEVASATKDGKTLAQRLMSTDAKEQEDAYGDFSRIRDRFRASLSPVVNADLNKFEQLPVVARKLTMSQDRIDLHSDILDETNRHHVVTEGQGDSKVKIGQQNADTRKESADTRKEVAERAGAGETINTGMGKLSLDSIRNILASGDQGPEAAHHADVLKRLLLAIPSGAKDPRTGAAIPRYKDSDISQWAAEGLAKKAAASGAAPGTPPVGKSGPNTEPPLPAGPAVTPAAPAPENPADVLSRKLGIPGMPNVPAGKPTALNDLPGSLDPTEVQGYLKDIGLGVDEGDMFNGPAINLAGITGDSSGSGGPAGFGGFGLPT